MNKKKAIKDYDLADLLDDEYKKWYDDWYEEWVIEGEANYEINKNY